MANQQKVAYDLSNGIIYLFSMTWTTFTPVSRSRHFLMLNISETVQDTEVVSMEY